MLDFLRAFSLTQDGGFRIGLRQLRKNHRGRQTNTVRG